MTTVEIYRIAMLDEYDSGCIHNVDKRRICSWKDLEDDYTRAGVDG